MSFYVTLPSNASPTVFPNNEASHFFVKLPQTIEISSNYEVGLVEIHIPNTFCMLSENEVWLQHYSLKEGVTIDTLLFGIPASKGLDMDLILKSIKRLLKKEIEAGQVDVITSICNKSFKKVVVKVIEPELENTVRDWLKPNRVVPSKSSEKHTPEEDIKTVFVYCDLVASRPVGDVMVPLLRAVPIIEKNSSSVFRIYDKPHYIPLSRFSFDTVEILLCNDLGETLTFTSGTSVLTLHFRTRKHFELE